MTLSSSGGGGVFGGMSAYDRWVAPNAEAGSTANRVELLLLVRSAAMYVGGSWGITVSGKYLGTKGAGPDICGESSEAFVWSDSWSRRSLFAARCRLRMMLRARPRENSAKTPTLPPTAPAKVAMLCFLIFGSAVGLGELCGAVEASASDV